MTATVAHATVALVPVKTPGRAKTRLNPVLEQDECARLAMAMLRDVLDALTAARQIDAIAVVTDDAEVAEFAAVLGHRVMRDSAVDLCAALDSAAAELAAQGTRTVMIIPADMPTITSDDLDRLLERHEGGVSISPAIRDGGTNALICSPPDAVAFCYGRDSARKHMLAAERNGINCNRLPVPAFFRDVDLPDDLAWLVSQQQGKHTLAFLQHSGIGARINSVLQRQAS